MLLRRWVRRGIIGALLLGVVAFLVAFVRLDEHALRDRVVAQLEQTTGRTVHGGKTRLSLQHGVSLKIRQVKLAGPGADWELEADVVRFDLDIVSLLFGDLRLSGVDLVHPLLRLGSAISPSGVFSGPLLERLMMETPLLSFRQGRIELRGQILADQMAATLRRIDREQQTTWEVQSRYAGGDFSTQGYIRSDNNGGDRMFGRISATQLQLAQIAHLPLPSLHYDVLDASLTFSLDAAGQWAWFGNLLTRDAHAELPELSWRGKLNGRSPDDFRLQDAFVQFGEKTRLTLIGGCERALPCRLEIDTSGANPGMILKAGAIDVPLEGKLDGRIELNEKGDGWDLNGKLGLHETKWEKIDLPDTQIEIAGLHMESPGHYRLSHARIEPKGGGMIEITGLAQEGGRFRVATRLSALKDAWAPIGTILLEQAGIAAQPGSRSKLAGSGEVNGSLDWSAEGEDALLQFSLEADKAALKLDKRFSKPAGMAARVDGLYRSKSGLAQLELAKLQLGESRLGGVRLAWRGDAPELSVSDIRLDMDKLKAGGVLLPGPLAGWQGELQGELQHIALPGGAGVPQWLVAADGGLRLSRFDFDGQVWNGALKLRHGRIRADGMSWHRGADFADFTADVDLARMQGKVDVSRAGFAWSPEMSLPGWLAGAELGGIFSQTDMQWNGNTWKGMQGAFTARGGSLRLEKVRGRLGGGIVQSRKLDIEAVAGGIRFSGLVGTTAVHLNDLQGLADATGATMDGYVFANARLAGSLPLGSGAWSGNGDIEIHRGLWKEARAAHHIQWLNVAAAKLDDGDRFDRLNVRFRFAGDALQLRRLVFSRDRFTAGGEADISASGVVRGGLTVRQQDGEPMHTGLAGRWPSLSGFFQPASGP